MASGQRLPARPQGTACVRFLQSWRYDYLAEHDPILQQPESLVRLWERQGAIDDWREFTRADEVQQRSQVLTHPTIRTEDFELERPDVAQILFRIETSGGAARQESTLPVQCSERGYPRVAPGEIHHHVDAAIKSASMRFPVLGIDP